MPEWFLRVKKVYDGEVVSARMKTFIDLPAQNRTEQNSPHKADSAVVVNKNYPIHC